MNQRIVIGTIFYLLAVFSFWWMIPLGELLKDMIRDFPGTTEVAMAPRDQPNKSMTYGLTVKSHSPNRFLSEHKHRRLDTLGK